MNRALGHFCAHTLQAKLCEGNLLRMVRWVRRHCPPDTGFDIQTLAVWDRARYLSVTEAPHNTKFCEWMGGGKHFCFFQTAETGKRTSNSSVKGSGANCTKAPAHDIKREMLVFFLYSFILYQSICFAIPPVPWKQGVIYYVCQLTISN